MGNILVFGGSVTYGAWDKEGGWVMRFRKYIDQKFYFRTGRKVLVYNLGVSGENIVGLAKRAENELKSRLFQKDQGLLIFSVSTNDCNPYHHFYRQVTEPQKFKESLSFLISIAQTYHAKVVVLGLPPVNEKTMDKDFKGALANKLVKEYDGYASQICQERGVEKADLFKKLSANRSFIDSLIDGIHPNSTGHEILFEEIKNFLGEKGLID